MVKTGMAIAQGTRDQLEDRYFLDTNFSGKSWIFGGVYDGHGGYQAAEYASKNLHKRFLKFLESLTPQDAFIATYESISAEIEQLQGGACAANFLIKGNEIFFANAGDCRIIIVGDEVNQLTIDHRTNNSEEAKRISGAGGVVQGQYVFAGSQGLMVTRSLGDQSHKSVGVIATPYVGSYQLLPSDKFLIAATDGLFDKLSNEAIAKIAMVNQNSQGLADKLKEIVLEAKYADNVTVLVLDFVSEG